MVFRVIFLLILVTVSKSPLIAQVDTEFWFVAPEVTSKHADRPIYLRISSLQSATTVTISQPANPTFAPITKSIEANSTVSVDLSAQIAEIENAPPDQVLNHGIYIKASNPITAYYEVFGSSQWSPGVNSDIFVLKGNHALGKEFYTPFQTHWNNIHDTRIDNAWSSFDIVASQDNTVITIVPSKDIVGHTAGIPFNVTLQKGQTYSARASSYLASEHLSGSHITSSKPIAVTTKDDSIIEGNNYDLAGDQMIPLNYIGKEYIAIKVSETNNIDRLYLVGTKPNTDIFVDGTGPIATINAGDTYEIHMLNPTSHITASDSIYVWHVAGFTSELGGAILPPIGCTGSRQVSFTRSTNEDFYIEIVVKTGYEQYFRLNNNASLVPASLFNTVPGTSGFWKYTRIPFNSTTIAAGSANLIQNDSSDFQLSTLNGGATTGFRYGYFSDFGFLELGSDKGICEGDSTILNAGFFKDSYLWNTGNTGQYLTVKDSGMYYVTVTKGTCQIRDSVRLNYLPKITNTILGNDTAGCNSSSFFIQTQSPFSSYLWSDGTTEPMTRAIITGNYTVLVSNEYGCKKEDTVFVTVYPAPTPKIIYDTDLDKYCKNPFVYLEADQTYSNYYWSTGDTTKSIVTTHNESDTYTLRALNNYGCSRTVKISIDCSPVVGLIPNLLTPNEDGKNDVFYIEYLRPNKWILEVYNRWGDRVYKNDNYDNSFNPKDLNDGIYYFSFRHKEGKGENKGWLQILR